MDGADFEPVGGKEVWIGLLLAVCIYSLLIVLPFWNPLLAVCWFVCAGKVSAFV